MTVKTTTEKKIREVVTKYIQKGIRLKHIWNALLHHFLNNLIMSLMLLKVTLTFLQDYQAKRIQILDEK